jgi:hypothetical protein
MWLVRLHGVSHCIGPAPTGEQRGIDFIVEIVRHRRWLPGRFSAAPENKCRPEECQCASGNHGAEDGAGL